jgi:23S rRNA (cytidine1920-2'-O)/16S rRNA (cytidine1409-2'-O)-methyltransferase
MERTNARYLTHLPEPIDIVTLDASFISLKLLLPAAKQWLQDDGQAVPLIKPQFEAGRRDVGKGGVVRDPDVHRRVLTDLLTWMVSNSWQVQGLIPSPLLGPSGNVEFLVHLVPDGLLQVDIDPMVEAAMSEVEQLKAGAEQAH